MMEERGRDRRFVAAHRGGALRREDHRLLVAWAAACAGHVLGLCWDAPEDDRPLHAVRQAEAWARGEIATGTVMRSAVAAHAAARTSAGTAQAAARAAGHAAATAHMADHSLAAASYALQAAVDGERERRWQDRMLPPAVRPLVLEVRADHRGASPAGGRRNTWPRRSRKAIG